MKKITLVSLLIVLFLILGTVSTILYGKGYRLSFQNGAKIEGTGLLVLTSVPDGAKVIINNELKTATNNTINLPPGEYQIKIEKDGYIPWKKKIKIQTEIVSKAEALLFPTAPKLEALTSTGAQDPILDPTNSLIAYTVSSASAKKNGIYTLEMSTKSILNFTDSTVQLTDETLAKFSKAKLEFAPDGKQIIAILPDKSAFLLSAKSYNPVPQEITSNLTETVNKMNKQQADKETKLISAQKEETAQLIKKFFTNISFSEDGEKVLYTASQSAKLPIIIEPRLIGTNSTQEDRDIKKDNIYVYDIKEDRNYPVLVSEKEIPSLTWYPDSKHLLFVKDQKINIMEFDSQNLTTVYAGPFIDNFVFPWPDASSIVILTNLNSVESPPNLYRLILK